MEERTEERAINEQLTLLYDHVMLLADKKSDLYVPPGTTLQAGPGYATVVAVGPGRPSEYSGAMIPMPQEVVMSPEGDYEIVEGLLLKPGVRVLYHTGAGTPVEFDGQEYRLVFPRDIIAVMVSR